MNKTLSKWGWMLATVLVVMTPALAFASGDDEVGHVITTAIWQAINIALFLGAGIWFGRKGVGKMLRDRRAALMADLNEAKRLREEARGMLEEYEGKVGALEDERKAILDEYREMGAAESRRIIEQAKEQAAKISADAEQTVAADIARAKAELEAQVLALATEMTEKALAERLTQPRQKALVDQYIKDIETHFEDGSVAH